MLRFTSKLQTHPRSVVATLALIKCLVDKNPRRQNTHGFHSMGILINAGEPVSYEAYIAQGGRRQDLAWDINKGYAEVV